MATEDPVSDLESLIAQAESAEELKTYALKAVKNWAFARAGLDGLNSDLDTATDLLRDCAITLCDGTAGEREALAMEIEEYLDD